MVCDVQHFCWVFRHTSSIHRRESRVLLPPMAIHSPSCLSSLDISSIRAAYAMSDRTPSCLMLSLILFSLLAHLWLVFLLLDWTLISESSSSSSLQFHFCVGCRWLHPAKLCHMFSVQPRRWCMLSVQPRRWCMLPFLFLVISLVACFNTMQWSAVELLVFPPAWAFVMWIFFFTLSLMILSYTFSTWLVSVIPLSLEHLPFTPFPL